jgi:5-formyltetrahydrofolate cyclo-ligase
VSPGSSGHGAPGDGAPAKPALRADYRGRRRALARETVARESRATAETCARLLAERAARELASYLALPDELDLDHLHQRWWADGRRIWFPRALPGGELRWHALTSPAPLRPGAFGIREPDPALAPEAPLPAGVTVLVPGVAFAADGRRLGQGKGYYDRLLERAAGGGAFSIGVGFSCQRCDELPHEPHDRRVDAVVLGGAVLRGG